MPERRKLNRRNFSYYMRMMDAKTGALVGHLTDISAGGFKIDSQKPIAVNQDFNLRIELTTDISNMTFMVFSARSRWCEHDHLDPTFYNVGFQITNITPSNLDIFTRMFEKYGTQSRSDQTI
jgi:PilZ domain